MFKSLCCLFFVFFCSLFVFSFGAEEDVIVLTKDNFDSEVLERDIILVEFYAPWCGHCKKLAPNYAEAAGILKKRNPPIPLAKVDATEESELAQRYNIRGYPTLKLFQNGVHSDYKGPRDTNAIVKFMEKQAAPSFQVLENEKAYKKFISEPYQSSVIGFFEDRTSSKGKAFVSAATSFRDYFRFGLVQDKKLAGNDQESIVIFRPFGEEKKVYSGNYDKKDIEDFLFKNYLTTVPEWTEDHSGIILRSNKPVLKAFFDVSYGSNFKRTNYFRNRIKKIATMPEFSDELVFTMADKKKLQPVMDQFGFDQSAEISVGIEYMGERFKMEEEFNVRNLQKFVKNYLDKKVEPYIKSEPIPESNDGPVTVVVGKTFKDIVLDDSKDVLIELYAPWCGHCKKLEPIYTELGESMKDVKDVVIAKMDATANDVPHGAYQARGFPTILFAPAGKKDNPIKYQGERQVKAFKEFLKKNSSKPKKQEKDEL